MLVLGIDSSCDDMSAAVLCEGREVLSNVTSSQEDIHVKYGGIVPELASRRHLETVIPVVEEALKKASVSLSDIDGIGVTYGPGLVGSLLVGLSFAKAVSLSKGIPFIGINHLEGHIAIAFLEEDVSLPFIALLVSGGHTLLCRVDGFGSYRLLGQTRDDAAGEAFDKVAKVLGIGYPGGIHIDRLSQEGRPDAIDFPRAYISKESFDFSFSGLKTAVFRFVRDSGRIEGEQLNDLAASFQEAVVEVLVEKTVRACIETGVRDVFVTGGVAANTRLRERISERAEGEGIRVRIPPKWLCTDNGVMIGVAAYRRLVRGESSPLNLNAVASLGL